MQTTTNSSNVVRQQVYSAGLQESYETNLLGFGLFADMSSLFPDGDTFNVDQIGEFTLADYSEDAPIDYSALDTSRITLSISDYPGLGFYMTDALKQDSNKADLLFGKAIKKAIYAFEKDMETSVYAACNDSQTTADANTINGEAHRRCLDNPTAQALVDAIADIKTSFDRADVPEVGRILIVDPRVENIMNKLGGTAVLVADSPRFEGLLETGFARNHRFVRSIHGFDVFTSNLLPEIADETIATVQVQSGVCNIAMCVADDDAKPIMGVIRQAPEPEMERNAKHKRDEWSATARWGFAAYRPESLYCLLVDFA